MGIMVKLVKATVSIITMQFDIANIYAKTSIMNLWEILFLKISLNENHWKVNYNENNGYIVSILL